METTGHVREATTPMPDGTLLADCSCGAEYSVPQGGDEFGALEAAHARHAAQAATDPAADGTDRYTIDQINARADLVRPATSDSSEEG